MRTAYSYVVLRYAHDPAAGERLNVGVLVYSPEGQYLDLFYESTYSRLSAAFANFDGASYRRTMSELERGIQRIREQATKRSLIREFHDAAAIALRLWPDPGLSFRFGEQLGGVTEDLPATARALFERFVVSQFTKREYKRRDADDVWKVVEHHFDPAALRLLKPMQVTTKYDQHVFERAYRNGRLYVVEPISFDYADPSDILDKAAQWRGRLDIIATNSDAHDGLFHFIVGRPQDDQHRRAADRAMEMMRDSTASALVEPEELADTVAEKLSRVILADQKLPS